MEYSLSIMLRIVTDLHSIPFALWIVERVKTSSGLTYEATSSPMLLTAINSISLLRADSDMAIASLSNLTRVSTPTRMIHLLRKMNYNRFSFRQSRPRARCFVSPVPVLSRITSSKSTCSLVTASMVAVVATVLQDIDAATLRGDPACKSGDFAVAEATSRWPELQRLYRPFRDPVAHGHAIWSKHSISKIAKVATIPLF